ncbi:MAG: hypothetical protein IJK41_07900 [Muribaculaceae bacterium]|nr:hypothetical protein [Muribaculaceae bacterium]
MEEQRPDEYLADFELMYTKEELDKLEFELSKQQEEELEELYRIQLEAKQESDHSIIKDMLEATKEGAMNFINSFTDTMDTFDHMKNPKKVNSLDDNPIKRNPIGSPERPLKDAQKKPFDNNSTPTTEGMSEEGIKRFKRFESAYKQRTKSLTSPSKPANFKELPKAEQDAIKTTNNNEKLSGIRGYRFGPIVPPLSIDEFQSRYKEKLEKNPEFAQEKYEKHGKWVRQQNYSQLDDKLVEVFGFKNRSAAKKWREDNHLTPHETADGTYLVPEDLHASVNHDGYCMLITKKLAGKGKNALTQQEFDAAVRQEKVAYIKHEAKTRAVRAGKGIAMSIVRDFAKASLVIVIDETYTEFKEVKEGTLLDRIKRVINQIWEKIKSKCHHFIKNIWDTIKNGIKGALLSEFFTLLNDFVFKTFKNVFRVMRTMWGSIVKAFKIIFSGTAPWQERIFEATKILSSAVVGVIGFSLNELIEKGLTSIGIPFASFFAELLSGLFSGILSSIVLMIFDNLKRKFLEKSPYYKQMLVRTKINRINCARLDVSTLKTELKLQETYNFFSQTLVEIAYYRKTILDSESYSKNTLTAIDHHTDSTRLINEELQKMLEEANNEEF